eukprot:TRINITY_DN39549_c0_g2_i2.p1 TRINITY_DN39549_c0_g2~~TRINITY_DN39549_c0_g2_i2.p1  ORF type:complete len:444 (-),score=76.87 TRINITY_DN39549_c0_g2_i2:63-1394(-)
MTAAPLASAALEAWLTIGEEEVSALEGFVSRSGSLSPKGKLHQAALRSAAPYTVMASLRDSSGGGCNVQYKQAAGGPEAAAGPEAMAGGPEAAAGPPAASLTEWSNALDDWNRRVQKLSAALPEKGIGHGSSQRDPLQLVAAEVAQVRWSAFGGFPRSAREAEEGSLETRGCGPAVDSRSTTPRRSRPAGVPISVPSFEREEATPGSASSRAPRQTDTPAAATTPGPTAVRRQLSAPNLGRVQVSAAAPLTGCSSGEGNLPGYPSHTPVPNPASPAPMRRDSGATPMRPARGPSPQTAHTSSGGTPQAAIARQSSVPSGLGRTVVETTPQRRATITGLRSAVRCATPERLTFAGACTPINTTTDAAAPPTASEQISSATKAACVAFSPATPQPPRPISTAMSAPPTQLLSATPTPTIVRRHVQAVNSTANYEHYEGKLHRQVN